MKTFLFIIYLISASNLFAEAINELALFGEQTKTAEEKQMDQEFIEQSIRAANGDSKAAVQQLLNVAWKEISKRNFVLAIKRFNQAYLLEPDNYEIFWGLAAATSAQHKYRDSEKLFKRAMELHPNDARLISDYAFSLINQGIYYGEKEKPKIS